MNRRHVKSLVLIIGLLVQATLLYMPSSPTLAETGRTTTTVTSTTTSIVTATTTATTTLTTEAADFQIIISPNQKVVNPGGSPTFSVLVQRWKYTLFTDVSLTLEGAPATFSYNFDPPSGRTDFSSVLSITVNPDTPKGEYALTVVGFGDGKYRRAGLSLIVTGGSGDADFMVSLSPHILAVKRPESGTISTQTTITVKSLNGYSGDISLTCGWVSVNPGGTSISLELTELRVEADSEVSTNLIITIDSSASLGNFTLSVYGNDGVKTRYDIAYLYISTETLCMISVVSHPVNGVPIDLSGDVTGKGVTPFEIGPRKTPFSVMLTAPSVASAPGQAGGQLTYAFSRWLLDEAAWENNVLSIQTSQEQNVRTADARYFLSHPIYVTIHIPANGTIVSGFVPIVASVYCSQGHPIDSCRYKVDAGSWVDMLWNTTHWIAQWDSTGVSNGLHRITVRGTCSHDAYGEAWVEVITDNAPPQPVYTYYVNHISGVWTPSRKFLPGETMGVDYFDPTMTGRWVTISPSADIVYTPKTPSRTQMVLGSGRASFALKFEHTICGEYIVTWSWMDGDLPRSFQTTFKVVGAKATQWSVYHLYDRCEVHTLLTWFDDLAPVLNRQGTIEAYSIYGPYRNVVKNTIASDGAIIILNIPYYDWSGDATFTIAYIGSDIKILTSTGQENVKTFKCDVLAASYTLQGQDYVMTTQATFFLKYQPAIKASGVRLSINCPETYDWVVAQISNDQGAASATLTLSGTPSYFRLFSWAWMSQPSPLLHDYIIAAQYANLKVAEERVATQPTVINAHAPYFTVDVQLVSQTQWMDLSSNHATIRVEVWNVAETERAAWGDFHVGILHGTINQYDLRVDGAGAGTWVVKVYVSYYGALVGQTQATVIVA